MVEHKHKCLLATAIVAFLLYNAYFIGVIIRYEKYDLAWEWCDELGFLFIITVITYAGLIYYQIIKRFFGRWLDDKLVKPAVKAVDRVFSRKFAEVVLGLIVVAGISAFVIIDSLGDVQRLVSLAGIFALILIGFLTSVHPGNILTTEVFGSDGSISDWTRPFGPLFPEIRYF